MLGLPRCQTKKKQTSRHQTLFQLERREKIGYFNDVKTEAHTVTMCCSAETKQVNGEKWRSCVLFVRNEKKTNTHSQSMSKNFHHYLVFFPSFHSQRQNCWLLPSKSCHCSWYVTDPKDLDGRKFSLSHFHTKVIGRSKMNKSNRRDHKWRAPMPNTDWTR